MLTLEALFTALLAWLLYRETMDRRVWAAMLLLLAGGVVLVLDQGRSGGGQALGLLAVLLATAAWGADNTLSRALAERAPFIGAALAVALGDRSAGWLMGLGGVLMLTGILLHLAESHGHEHEHEAMAHEHAHRHDDGHHDHLHEPMPIGAHSHAHRHKPIRHTHPHVPDAHHAHRH